MRIINILFLCTANSCRSILSEAIFNYIASKNMKAFSAGSEPSGIVNKDAIAILKANKVDTSYLYSKSVNELDVKPDIVIALCDDAAEKLCPFLADSDIINWSITDPSKVADKSINIAFEQTYLLLNNRISKLAQLPLHRLLENRVLLKKALEQIAKEDIDI